MLNVMPTKTSSRIRGPRAWLIGLATVVWPSICLAQQAAPPPNLKQAPPVWLGFLVMFVLLAVVMAVSLMPSKRSHQD